MAASPDLKVFNPSGEYVASCKHAEDAAAILAMYGAGSRIGYGHRKRDTIYINGIDGNASESFDAVAEIVNHRVECLREADRLGARITFSGA